jgi:hypothetical protein
MKLNIRPQKTSAERTSDTPSSIYGSNSISPLTSEVDDVEEVSTGQQLEVGIAVDLPGPPDFSLSMCKTAPADITKMMSRFEKWAHENYLLGSPRVDLLLTLIQFNVLRALFSNTFSIGFDLEWLINGEAISPFNSMTSDESEVSIPESLRPTHLQSTVPHHPWIDLFPLPKIRDNLLLAGEDYDDTAICMDVVEIGGKPNEACGLIVWGEPWDPYAWEASPEFLQKWAWVVKGCHTLIQSTNYWRMRRGEKQVIF